MLELKTKEEVKQIVDSLVKASTKDLNALTKKSYTFIMLANGFIAHYGIQGFKDYYKEPENLRKDILKNQAINQWSNFHPNERNYEYYMQKKEIYNLICERIK
jgi:hypothetical protein